MSILRNILRFRHDSINTLIFIMICEFQNYFWILFCNEQLAVLCILFLTLYSYAQFNTWYGYHELPKPIGVRNSSNNYFVLSRMRLSWDRNIKKWTLPQLIQTYNVFQGNWWYRIVPVQSPFARPKCPVRVSQTVQMYDAQAFLYSSVSETWLSQKPVLKTQQILSELIKFNSNVHLINLETYFAAWMCLLRNRAKSGTFQGPKIFL